MSASIDMKEILSRLRLRRQRDLAVIEKAAGQFASHVVGDAQQITPVKTGFLQSSATFEKPQITEENVVVVVGFNASYAAAVHERLNVHHEPPGQAKFLETAIRNDGPKFVPFIAEKLRAAN